MKQGDTLSLPKGWEIKKLGEVADVGAGNSAPQKKELFENGKFPFFRTSDIGKIRKGFIETSVDYLNEKGIKGLKLFQKGTILFPKSGASTFLNHRVIMNVDGYVSSHLATIKAKLKIADDRFLLYYLITIDAKDLMQDIAYPSLKTSDVGLIPIPLPPLPEQQRIVSILDEAFAAIAKAKANAEQNLKNAKELFESYLQGVFENGNWETKKLNEITEVKDGTHDSPKYIKVGIPFVTQKNIKPDGLSFDDTKFITDTDHDKFYKRSNVTYGDILISMIGANRGMAAIVDDKRVFSIKNVGLIKSSDNINMNYLLYYLKSSLAMKYVLYMSNGGAQEFVGLTALRSFPIPFPTLKEQNEIVGKLDALILETKKLEAIYQQKIDDLEELKKSILQKAFSGDLPTLQAELKTKNEESI